ncbi:precorrin-2 dehydrogenase/sirohydrochlorin ferrochelatase [Lewinella marina]|uniref:precorrin-2 dehydrogenase n=1 Tax=Neolewinella marina TaxID=438751 RepID=A0A2G0CH49_9BACT|nr:bifunctional precorrin-2 dehydrogenase/sirohydrochlorin ferrochelatase [Neolewinella marina]NJB86278.1 precorrin-2 dehydrogenase/sirohydrochlorin ferrochelatase [Neolewinella marina]PHK99250.1 siroheme synthase [Neolewinella marina]
MDNPLYPAFFRLDRLEMLVVGAGQVGEEKLSFILKSSPNARVTVVAPWMGEELQQLLDRYAAEAGAQVPGDAVEAPAETPAGRWRTAAGGRVTWFRREFHPDDVKAVDLVIAATNFHAVNRQVWEAAKAARRLANIADTPSLCDFYLGSIVTRGPLKVAISTNGQSPTFAKRFRQWLEAELPAAETTELIDNLKLFRDRLTGDFRTKVRELNTLTSGLLAPARSGPRRCPPGGCLLAAGSEPNDLGPASPPELDGSGSENLN